MIFHILGDWVDGKPSGLHYWMKYHLEEAKGKMNYLGYQNLIKIGKVNSFLIVLLFPLLCITIKKQIMKIYIDEDLLDRFTIALGRSS